MRLESKRIGGRVRRPLLSLSTFFLAVTVGIISSFVFSTAYDMTRSALGGERQEVSGVWRGSWHNVPAVTINLQQQGERLSGTVSFNRIFKSDNGFESEAATQEVPLVNPRFDGKRLLFELQVPDEIHPPLFIEMEMSFDNEEEAGLRCTRRDSIDVPVAKETVISMKHERSF
jgi:hypothetical protein